MKSRPLSVTLICFLFIVAGGLGVVYHGPELKTIGDNPEIIWALLVRVLAIVGAVFALRGSNLARWFLISWIVYHVILSIFHTTAELAVHIIFAIVIAIALFHPKANAFFQKK